MKKHIGKFGTDSRFPYWRGGAIDTNVFNGGTAIALILNWGLLIFAHSDLVFRNNAEFGTASHIIAIAVALIVCVATVWLIRHSDPYVLWFTRSFACGLPLAVHLFLLLKGAMFFW